MKHRSEYSESNYKRWLWPLLTILICVLIFVFSSQNGDESSNTSGRLVTFLKSIFGNAISEDVLVVIVRKGAHISIYFILGIFASLSSHELLKDKSMLVKCLTAITFCFLYACSDELHQLFVSERSGSFVDVCIDASGFVTSSVLVGLIKHKKKIVDIKKM